MKILVSASFAESLVRFRGRLLLSLINHGLSVHTSAPELTDQVNIHKTLRDMNCICHDVPLARTGVNPLVDVVSIVSLTRLMLRERPNFFLGYTIKPVIYGLVAARIARVQHRTALITGLGSTFDASAVGRKGVLFRLVLLLYRIALRGATKAVFQNPDDRDLFVKLGLIEIERTALVHGSGVPLDEFKQLPLPSQSTFNFLFIGRLIRDKGVYEYINAARTIKARHLHATFHLVGKIDSNPTAIRQSELDKWIAEGLVEYHGHVENVQGYLREAHVFVLPSHQGEGTPRSILEALATGRAVITTDAPGCRETVVDGFNGFVVPRKNFVALAEAMEAFLRDSSLASSMGQRSREIAEEKYDVEKVNEQMLLHLGVTR